MPLYGVAGAVAAVVVVAVVPVVVVDEGSICERVRLNPYARLFGVDCIMAKKGSVVVVLAEEEVEEKSMSLAVLAREKRGLIAETEMRASREERGLGGGGANASAN